jgi:hypothetical protein
MVQVFSEKWDKRAPLVKFFRRNRETEFITKILYRRLEFSDLVSKLTRPRLLSTAKGLNHLDQLLDLLQGSFRHGEASKDERRGFDFRGANR